MLTGICLNCGTTYWGWALSKERHQICPKCGSLIKVTGYGKAETQNTMSRERTIIEEGSTVGERKKFAHDRLGKGGALYHD